jgi:cytochrome c556
MRKWLIAVIPMVMIVGAQRPLQAHEEKDLPEGPIRDRHHLMHEIGDNAKIIGDALKAHNFSPVAEAAQKIQADAPKIAALFPKGSTHPKSRAKPEIWTQWAKFEEGTKQLEAKAGALATAAKENGDVPAAGKALFGACKSCHDDFRVPEKEKGKD